MQAGNALGEYLRARREFVSPESAGVPHIGRRRVPGLHRDELSLLAGVSINYYVRLEQGRDRNPSPRYSRPSCCCCGLAGAPTPRPYIVLKRVRSAAEAAGQSEWSTRLPSPDAPTETHMRLEAPAISSTIAGVERCTLKAYARPEAACQNQPFFSRWMMAVIGSLVPLTP
ncbi:MAG: helix-turn-helix transcriptional regulator [Solirubrobacteraceae bacterium]